MRVLVPAAVGMFGLVALWPGPRVGPMPQEQGAVTYRGGIARIFAAKCTGCHNPDGPAPFSLTTYADAKRKADLILKIAYVRTMPPTRGDSEFGFHPDYAAMSDGESIAIQRWMQAGAPEGVGAVPLMPASQPRWRLGAPDLILKAPPNLFVPPEGAKFVRIVDLQLPLAESKTLVAFDVRPASPKSARQALVAVEGPGEAGTFSPFGVRAERLVGAWAIGYPAWKLPDDAGLTLAPDSRLSVRMNHHPSGKREDAGFEVGLYFSRAPRQYSPTWITLGRRSFVIPGDPEYTTLEDEKTVGPGSRIISVVPEARGAGLIVTLKQALSPEVGRTILSVFNWDPRWVGAYNFASAPRLPARTRVSAEIQYANSVHGRPDLSLDEAKRLRKNPPIYSGPGENNELFWVHVQLLLDAKP